MIRRSRSSFVALVATALIAGAGFALPVQAAAPPSITIPVVGSGSGATFSGAFELTSFAVQNGQVVAKGMLTGLVTTATGVTSSIAQAVALPVSVGQTTCEILHLDLGPLTLNILGLQIDLSRIVLDITAQAGAGNRLGNLLCAVVGLLDNPGGLARLLNQILAALLG